MGMGIHLRWRKEGTTTTTRASGHEHKHRHRHRHKLPMMGPPRNFFTKGDAYGVLRREREGERESDSDKRRQSSTFTGRRRGREGREREKTGDMMPRGELQWEKLTDWSGQLTHPVSVSRKKGAIIADESLTGWHIMSFTTHITMSYMSPKPIQKKDNKYHASCFILQTSCCSSSNPTTLSMWLTPTFSIPHARPQW